ncbi:hypothetical protein Hanom_Chr05g00431811 [Helianthus anomalus]
MVKLLQQIIREIGMSIPSISTFLSNFSNPITRQLLPYKTLCPESPICVLLKSCEEFSIYSLSRSRFEED